MGLLDAVSDFVDGENPAEAKMNLLRDTLITLFDGTGIPASALQWPMTAGGVLDMDGHSLQNVGDLYNVVHVNGGTTFEDAVSSVLASDGGTIVIDPGATARTPVGGLEEINKSNVTIMGMGNNSILHIADRDNTGNGIKVSGDNFRLLNLRVTCEAGASNLESLILTTSTDGLIVSGCVFDAPEEEALLIGGGDPTTNFMIANNQFRNHAKAGVYLNNVRYGAVVGNSFENGTTDNIRVDSTMSYYTEDIMIASNAISGGATGIYSTLGASDPIKARVAVAGNAVSSTNALQLGPLQDVVVSGNTLNGTVAIRSHGGTFGNNQCNGNVTLGSADRVNASGNRFGGTFTIGGTPTNIKLDNNIMESDVTIPATSGLDSFCNNTVDGVIAALTSSDVKLFANNYATGGIT
jgi:hypothetical protein